MADVKDPVVGFKYGLEVSGKLSGYFTSVSGIGSETEVITQKIVSEKGEPIIKQIPGRLTWNPITLRRGVTDLKDVWDWRQMVVEGKIDDARKTQGEANEIICAILKHGGMASSKYLIEKRGFEYGTCREPFMPVTEESKLILDALKLV